MKVYDEGETIAPAFEIKNGDQLTDRVVHLESQIMQLESEKAKLRDALRTIYYTPTSLSDAVQLAGKALVDDAKN